MEKQVSDIHLAVHALHTSTGGGLVYLNGILPSLSADILAVGGRVSILVQPSLLEKVRVPEGVDVITADLPQGFLWAHLKAQFLVPKLLRARGVTHTLCNANFVPLLAPRPMPIIHTTPTVSQFTRGVFWWCYWRLLWCFTFVSLVRAPVAFTVAEHVVPRYTPWPLRCLRRKVHWAPPAVNAASVPAVLPDKTAGKIVAVGDFYIQKDYVTLVRAFGVVRAQIPTATLVIIGRFIQADVVQAVRAEIAAAGVGDAVTLLGPLPHHGLMAEVATAEILLSTSVAECFNMPLLEAMAVGTAVVARAADFQREVVGDAGAAVLVGGGAADYAAAVVDLLENDVKRGMQVDTGRIQAAKFGWEMTGGVISRNILQ